MAQKIVIEFEAGTDDLIKSLNAADKAAVKFSGSLTKSLSPIKKAATETSNAISSGFGDAFSTLTKGVAIGNLVSTGILGIAGSVKSFVTGSVAAAEQQEDAINRLSQALRTSGDFSQAAVDDFENFASTLQRASKFGDEVVLGQLAIAKSFGATNEQAKELVQAAANLSATFGGSLEERVQQLGKSLTGTVGRLGQFIPELKSLTQNQLEAGNAIDIVNKKFAGAAANELNTYSGRVTALSNAYSDLQESLGGFVTGSNTANGFIATTTRLLQELGDRIKLSTVLGEAQANGFVDSGNELNILSERYASVRDEIEKYQTVIDADKNKTLLQSIFSFDNAPRAKEKVQELSRELQLLDKQIAASSSKVVDGSASSGATGKSPAITVGEKELAERARINQAILQQQAEFDATISQSKIDNDLLTSEQRTLEFDSLLNFEFQKIEAIREAELAKTALITDVEARRLEQKRINEKADLDTLRVANKNRIDLQKSLTAAEQREQQLRLTAANNFLSAGLALAKEGSVAQKALAITQATINTYQAANQALADPLTPVALKPALAASFIALGLANVARISGAKFADGGIVGGTSMQGDRVPALLNSREMVLNMGQQRELFNMANGSGRSGSDMSGMIRELISEMRQVPIIVQANGREIARLIRDEGRNGFEVLA
jgi:hypothetical protein